MKTTTNSNSSPFFSVIVPVYNKAPHIKRSIDSILNQTFSNFEIIIVDDASTDNSLDEIYKFDDSRITLYHREKPGAGGYAARNLGIEKATAEWIAFLDADDEWEVFHLQQIAEAIAEYPDIKVFASKWKTFENNKLHSNNFSPYAKKWEIISFVDFLKLSVKSSSPFWTSTIVINKHTLKTAGGFPEGKAGRGGDVDTWLRVMDTAQKGLLIYKETAIYYRDSINMTTKSSYTDPTIHFDTTNFLLNKYHNAAIKELLEKRANNIAVRNWKINLFFLKKNFRLRLFFYPDYASFTHKIYCNFDYLPFNLKKTIFHFFFALNQLIRKSDHSV
ncbi:MAG: glycosyltransferase family 2 protein [Bacteroidales bacterium]|jgi:glycosyltransferase involved in cell wall biosynthesis|nr:glycosyltransferase family 2 protein [Bacteroidales bacterium]